MTVRLRLGEELKARGLSQVAFVKLTGLNPNTVSKLAGPKVQMIRFDTLDRICTALGLEPADLLVREKDLAH